MDSYSDTDAGSNYEVIEKTCAVQVDSSEWGSEDCRCIGISPQPGTTNVNIKGKSVAFPADTGATCKAWEEDNHPDCKGNNPPSFCHQAWCYLDPCSCKTAVPPKTSSYLPDSKYQGKPIYYSYATCGEKDAYTAKMNAHACVNQETPEECAEYAEECTWVPQSSYGWSGCVGKKLTELCDIDLQEGERRATVFGLPRGGADIHFLSPVSMLISMLVGFSMLLTP